MMLAAAAGDANWMKYSEGACDETLVLGRATTTSFADQIHWPIASRSGTAGGRSSAVKHEELAFIFIKRCLSPHRAGWTDAAGNSGQWRGAAKRPLLSRHPRCTGEDHPGEDKPIRTN